MSVYLVALTEPDANAWKAIEKTVSRQQLQSL